MAESKVLWVDRDVRLEELCDRLTDVEAIYVDTEFVGDRTYVPRLCLIQVASRDLVACIDPLAGLDLAPFWELLRDPAITKVLHAADNDLALFVQPCAAVPAPVFDTQIAAAFCGHGAQIGYANLVRALCDVEIDKSMQRTDWARRPLSQAAIRYAAGDVTWLRDIHAALVVELDGRGRTAWADEEFERRRDPARFLDDPRDAWRRVRGRERVIGADLAVLVEIARWRETVAASSNRPRRWVLSDEICVAVAQERPADEAAIRKLRGFEARRHGSHTAALLAIVRATAPIGADAAPRPDRPSDEREAGLVDAMQVVVRRIADQHGLPPEIVATNDDLLRIARGDTDVAAFDGWRREILGTALIDLVARRRGRSGR